MFGRLRLQLTLWYVVALATTLLVVGGLVYWLVDRSLDGQVNAALQDANQLAAQVLRQEEGLDGLSRSHERDDESDHDEEEEEHDEYTAVFSAALLSSTGDVLPLVLDTEGQVISNPRQLSVDRLPLSEALSDARASGSVRRDSNIDGNHVRMLAEQVLDDDGRLVGFVVTLKSLEEHDQDVRRLMMLLAVGGGVGLVLAAAGGFWIAQFAIRPVQRAFQRQRDFVADASHELRTPLTVVRLSAESLLGKTSSVERELLREIVDETEYMTRLVSDLLTLAQADRAELELQRQPIDLYDAVQTAARIGGRLAQGKQIELTSSAEHVVVDADPERLRELLLILVDNALRYTPKGGRVTIEAKRAGRQAEVFIKDTGIGIEREHLGRIFDRFYRVDKARSRAEGGLGLGLSIARAIVEAHGGSIEVRSSVGSGTTVRVGFPQAPSRKAADVADAEPEAGRGQHEPT